MVDTKSVVANRFGITVNGLVVFTALHITFIILIQKIKRAKYRNVGLVLN